MIVSSNEQSSRPLIVSLFWISSGSLLDLFHHLRHPVVLRSRISSFPLSSSLISLMSAARGEAAFDHKAICVPLSNLMSGKTRNEQAERRDEDTVRGIGILFFLLKPPQNEEQDSQQSFLSVAKGTASASPAIFDLYFHSFHTVAVMMR